MDRDGAGEVSGDEYLVVPDVREPWQPVRSDDVPESPIRIPSMLLLFALVAVSGVLFQAWPRAAAYQEVVDENLALKAQLTSMDARMSEVERMWTELQLYKAQLQSLSQAKGDHGPLPDEAMQGAGVEEIADAAADDAVAEGDTDIPEGDSDEPSDAPQVPLAPTDLEPANAWASSVAARMNEALARFDESEGDLDALMAELEGLRAVRDSLPGLWPAEGRFTSGFGWRRDPVRGTTKFHSGVDIANERGTAIYSVAPGVVTRSGTSSGYGRVIEIDHGFGVSTKYAHCTTLRVRVGERVERGDYIATMGSTGKSTGPHLHFELRIDGNAVDPLKYLPR